MELLVKQVKAHPDTDFYFFYPPYSLLWWDNMNRTGELNQVLYAAQASIQALLPCDNVKLYYFQNDTDIIYNLDLYMDPIHFTADINHYMVTQMQQDNYRLTPENYISELQKMREVVREIEESEIKGYY